jgi:hypothetical protein
MILGCDAKFCAVGSCINSLVTSPLQITAHGATAIRVADFADIVCEISFCGDRSLRGRGFAEIIFYELTETRSIDIGDLYLEGEPINLSSGLFGCFMSSRG